MNAARNARPLGRHRQYGSTGTISTELNSVSSSSSSSSHESSTIQPDLPVHRLSLDLSIANNEYRLISLTGHSRESSYSYSDISEEGGYYDRAARYRHRSRKTCSNFFETTLLTPNNFKLVISVSVWFMSYMIMGILGGSVAYMHFQRSDRDVPDPLPDFGYDLIPVSTITIILKQFLVVCGENHLIWVYFNR